jgi:hypothetical protein
VERTRHHQSGEQELVADGFVRHRRGREKVEEINAVSPGGMQRVERLYEIDVCPTVIEALKLPDGRMAQDCEPMALLKLLTVWNRTVLRGGRSDSTAAP